MGRERDRKKLRLRSMLPTLRGSLCERLRVRKMRIDWPMLVFCESYHLPRYCRSQALGNFNNQMR